jgi:hypothetical protein
VDGISGKYSVIKKFLEMEFNHEHDRKNNIPITLELRNLPTTIVSLCNIHGISINQMTSNGNVHQIEDTPKMTSDENCCDNEPVTDTSIQKIQSTHRRAGHTSDKVSKPNENTKTQCWLCDGPHSFH